jgi:hypothetical protein
LQYKVDCVRDLDKALGDIRRIRRQMAGSTEFRGYGPATLTATAAMAIVAACAQRFWLGDAAQHIAGYLAIWISCGVVSAALIGMQMYTRTHHVHSGMADEMIRMAVVQFLPAAGAGLLITVVLVGYVPASEWMLPGLWQIVFSLGVFASCRFLPKQIAFAGAWYLLTGLGCLALGGVARFFPGRWVFPTARGN